MPEPVVSETVAAEPSATSRSSRRGRRQPGAAELVVPESPGISTPLAETNDSAEELQAEEMLAVASAKARAFSERVLNMQAQFGEVLSKQFANQTVRDNYLAQSARRRKELGRGGGVGTISRQAGDAAGQKQLLDEEKRLRSESEIVQRKFETLLQEETWKRLAPSERDLVAKYDLIPKEVRDSVSVEASATVGSVPSPNQTADIKSKTPESWQVVPLEGTPYELAFPGKPEIQKDSDSIVYVCRDRDRAFVFRRFLTTQVPDGLEIEVALQVQTASAVEGASQQGIPTAVRTARLADLPAKEVCNYFLKGGLERAHLNCVTVIGREVSVVEVLNLEVSDEPMARQFFNSFRRRSSALEK